MLTVEQRSRYARHIALPAVGQEGQLRLLQSQAAIEDYSPAAGLCMLYLAAAGVGTLGFPPGHVLAPDYLFDQKDVGHEYVDAARGQLGRLNADVRVVPDLRPNIIVPSGRDSVDAMRHGAMAAMAFIAKGVSL